MLWPVKESLLIKLIHKEWALFHYPEESLSLWAGNGFAVYKVPVNVYTKTVKRLTEVGFKVEPGYTQKLTDKSGLPIGSGIAVDEVVEREKAKPSQVFIVTDHIILSKRTPTNMRGDDAKFLRVIYGKEDGIKRLINWSLLRPIYDSNNEFNGVLAPGVKLLGPTGDEATPVFRATYDLEEIGIIMGTRDNNLDPLLSEIEVGNEDED